MKKNIAIMCLNEKKILFSGSFDTQKELNLDFFSIKILEFNKIVVSFYHKKMIVYFNEIFILNNLKYIILFKDQPLNIIDNYYGDYFFERLIQNSFKKFFLNFFSNIFYLKISQNKNNLSYILKFFLILFFILLFFQNNSISSDIPPDTTKLLLQKNVYKVLKSIEGKAQFVLKEEKNLAPLQAEERVFLKKVEENSNGKKIKNFSQNLRTEKKNEDKEIQYFLKFIRKK